MKSDIIDQPKCVPLDWQQVGPGRPMPSHDDRQTKALERIADALERLVKQGEVAK